MKNYDIWKKFVNSGKIDDYLNYIACTREEIAEDMEPCISNEKEGGCIAGINYSNGNGSIGHASW